jgi:hypothetical protein
MAERRKTDLTPRAIELYARGCALRDAGFADVDAEGPEAEEFRRIDKRLCWSLLKRDLHMVSIFENLDGPAPAYMEKRNSPSHPDFNGCYSGRRLQAELQAGLEARRTR